MATVIKANKPPLQTWRWQPCVYCLRTAGDRTKKSFFNAEHVIPHCISKGIAQNPVLRDLVCITCNSSFSEVDSITRYPLYHAIISALYPSDTVFGARRAGEIPYQFRLQYPGSKLHGARCEVVRSNGGFELRLREQFAFERRDRARCNFVTADRFLKFALTRRDIASSYTRQVWQFEENRALSGELEHLQSLGWHITAVPAHEIDIAKQKMRETMERTVHRAVAKIAFNYLTWVLGFARRERVIREPLHPTFNEVKQFIRDERFNQPSPVTPSAQEFQSLHEPKTHGMHLTVLPGDEGFHVIVYVNLFGIFEWRVTLTRSAPGVVLPDTAHVWDFSRGTCREIC
jgi:hypothetical protein